MWTSRRWIGVSVGQRATDVKGGSRVWRQRRSALCRERRRKGDGFRFEAALDVSLLAFALLVLLGGGPQAVAGAAHRSAPGHRPHDGGVSPLAAGAEHSMSTPTYSASSANDVSPSVTFDGAEYLEVAWSGTTGLRGVVVAANGRIQRT
jgi:hypothetical protein